MTGKSHLTVGCVTYASLWLHPIGPVGAPLLAGSAAWIALPVALALVMLGSLLPDLDHPDARLANERIFGVPVLKPLAWLIGTLFGHRNITHSLLALAGLIALGQLPFLAWSWANVGWIVGWGYGFHLAADAMTKVGIPLFWPLGGHIGFPPLRALRFTTGTWPEGVIVTLLTLACLYNAALPYWS